MDHGEVKSGTSEVPRPDPGKEPVSTLSLYVYVRVLVSSGV